MIVSAAGGAEELVTDGVDALTHAPGDVDGLARCIERLVADPALRARLGAAGRAVRACGSSIPTSSPAHSSTSTRRRARA